ncbi:MAG TPA: spermidine/putrescine ABC transporter substrate-binding protein [Jiangellaceae bacterium]|nr:spermidine/putrescine ABC transporter substrate-binding protein [Jiangellaceae bacterium]
MNNTRITVPTRWVARRHGHLVNGVTRRQLLRGVGALGALAAGGSLAACGTDPVAEPTGGPTATGATPDTIDRSDEEKVLNFDNWPLYIDVDEDDPNVRPTLDAFQEQTGIQVNYVEAINDNEEYFAKISPQLSTGQPIAADLFVVTDFMVARLIRLGWLQELNHDNLPTVFAELDPALSSPGFDPGRSYSVPWQSGLTGIVYNKAAVPGGVTSLQQLLTDESLRGRVTLLAGMHESLPLLAAAQGSSLEDFTEEDVEAALEAVEQAIASGQIRRFTGNDYTADLASGDAVACLGWSGDAIQLQWEDENIAFVIPEEGGELWSDNMVVPAGATHKTNAERLMDYYYDPHVSAELAAWVNYICPVPAAKDAMADVDPELVEEPLIFPSAEDLANTGITRDIADDEEQRWTESWTTVIGG